MGFNSVLVLNNDYLGVNNKNTLETVWSCAEADMNAKTHNLNSRTGQQGVEMVHNQPSDNYCLMLIGNCTGKVLSETFDHSDGPTDYDEIELKLLKQLAEKHGFSLCRKTNKKVGK